jgi:hypothetical protein
MLEVTSQASEQKLDVNFADIYTKSALYQWVNYLSISLSPYVGSHSCRLWVIDGVQQWGKWRWWQKLIPPESLQQRFWDTLWFLQA